MLLAFFAAALVQADGPAFEGPEERLHEPAGLAFGADGELFVAEAGRHRVLRIDPDGSRTVVGPELGLWRPRGLAVDDEGRLYIADEGNDRVAVIGPGAEPEVLVLGRRGDALGELRAPVGVAVRGDRVAVADTGNGRVQLFSLRDGPLWSWGRDEAAPVRPVALAFTDAGDLLVADDQQHRIHVLDEDGAARGSFGGYGEFPGLLSAPCGVLRVGQAILVAERGAARLQVFDQSGRSQGFASDPVSAAPLRPVRLAFDPRSGHIAVAEPAAGRVRRIPLDAELSWELPSDAVPEDERLLLLSSGFSLGPALTASEHHLALVDEGGARVLVHDLAGPTALLKNPIGLSGDRNGRLSRPTAVLMEGDASILVADAGQRRLKRFSLGGSGRAGHQKQGFARFRRSLDLDALSTVDPRLRFPVEVRSLARGPEGEVFVLDGANKTVIELDSALREPRTLGLDADLRDPTGLAVSRDGARLFVVDARRRSVVVLDREGALVERWGPEIAGWRLSRVPGAAEWREPHGIAVAPDGSILVTDAGGDRVVRLTERGQFEAAWGVAGFRAGELCRPRGVAVTFDGRVCVLDHGNGRCQIFSDRGEFTNEFPHVDGMSVTRRAEPEPEARRLSAVVTAPAVANVVFAPAPAAEICCECDEGTDATTTSPRLPGDAVGAPLQGSLTSVDGSYRVRWRVGGDEFPLNEEFALEVSVTRTDEQDSAPVAVGLAVDADMPAHGHGVLQLPMVSRVELGVFRVDGILFHMPGAWEIYLDVTEGGVTERTVFEALVEVGGGVRR